jgi:hypothetical protein
VVPPPQEDRSRRTAEQRVRAGFMKKSPPVKTDSYIRIPGSTGGDNNKPATKNLKLETKDSELFDISQVHADHVWGEWNIGMGPIPDKSMGRIEFPCPLIFSEDEHKGVLETRLLQSAQSLLKKKPSVALSTLSGVGVKGGDLTPVLIARIVKGADFARIIVAFPGLTIVDTGHGNRIPVKEKTVTVS